MILLDANVLLDLFTDDPEWCHWSTKALRRAILSESVTVNPIIFAEVSLAFGTARDLDSQLKKLSVGKLPLPYEAAFRAGRAFLKYRWSEGQKRSPLPDFYIGAHAEVEGMTLLTRDATRYHTYFPRVRLITPEE